MSEKLCKHLLRGLLHLTLLKEAFLRNAQLDVLLYFLPSNTFLTECFEIGIILKSEFFFKKQLPIPIIKFYISDNYVSLS